MTADFFDGADTEPERDAGRPLIRPAGAPDHVRVPYTRASSLSSYITDNRHIVTWQMRYLTRAMGMFRDLQGLAAIETYSTGFDTIRDKANSASGRRLDDIARRALDRIGIHEKADYGTLVHGLTEPGARGPIPPETAEDVASFWAALREHGIQILATEVFTACDQTQSAGTFDHLVLHPDYGVVIADKKTGKSHPHEFGVQLSTYAHGDVYDFNTHERTALEDFAMLRTTVIDPVQINRDKGIVFAISGGKTKVQVVDLALGWRGAKAAAAARDYVETPMRTTAASMENIKAVREAVTAKIAGAATVDDLGEIWTRYKYLWNDALTTAASERKKALA